MLNANLDPVITLKYLGDQWAKPAQSIVMSRLPRFHEAAGNFDENSRVDVRLSSFSKPTVQPSPWDPPGANEKLQTHVDKWERAAAAKRKLERELVEMRKAAAERKRLLAEGKLPKKQKRATTKPGKTYTAKDGFLTDQDREES